MSTGQSCCFIAPDAAHGGELRWSKTQGGWTCRRHADDKLKSNQSRSKSAVFRALPEHAEHRLLAGRTHALMGVNGTEVQPLACDFILESLRIDLRHMGILPRLQSNLLTLDAVMSAMHKEKALGELNPTSKSTIGGLVSIIDALAPASGAVWKVAPHVVLAALTVRRFGGKLFAERYLEVLAEAGRQWRTVHAEEAPPLTAAAAASAAVDAPDSQPKKRGRPSKPDLVTFLRCDWSPASLRSVALRVADDIRGEGVERPVTAAHLPHSAVSNDRADTERHWDLVDWRLAHLLAPVLGSALIVPDGRAGSLSDFAWIAHHIGQYGGTEFLLKTPALDIVLAFH